MTLHLVNYEQDCQVDNIAVRLRIPNSKEIEVIEWHSPDGQSLELSWETEDGFAVFTVPTLNVYGLAGIRLN